MSRAMHLKCHILVLRPWDLVEDPDVRSSWLCGRGSRYSRDVVNYGGGGVEGIHPRGTIGAMPVGPTPLGPDKIVTVSPGLKVRYVSESGSGLALERTSWRILGTGPALRGGGA